MKTKKLFFIFLILITTYIIIEVCLFNFKHGHHVTYDITINKNKFNVDEIYTRHIKNENDNYYFEIKHQNLIFNFQIYNNFNRKNDIIENIRFYEDDEYACMLPIYKNKKIIGDFSCYNKKQKIYNNYYDVRGKNKELDDYVSKVKKYDVSIFNNNKQNGMKKGNLIVYKNNRLKKETLLIENYKGIYLINDEINNIKIFDKDVYKKSIAVFTSKYYVVADYNKQYKFDTIYLVNIKNGKKSTIDIEESFSLDMKPQGIVDEKLYLFDDIKKEQYEIDTITKEIKQSGNSDGIKKYDKGSFKTSSAYQDIYFTNYNNGTNFNGKEYKKIDKVGNKLSGYYYLYEQSGNKYKVYRVNVQNKELITYLFTTTDPYNIFYDKNYIYYKDNANINYYSDTTGIRTLAKYNELEFNNTIKFGIYIK